MPGFRLQHACVCRKPRPFDLIKESHNVGHLSGTMEGAHIGLSTSRAFLHLILKAKFAHHPARYFATPPCLPKTGVGGAARWHVGVLARGRRLDRHVGSSETLGSLFLELVEPGRIDWQMNRARFDRSTLGRHPHDLVAIRIVADGVNVMTVPRLFVNGRVRLREAYSAELNDGADAAT